ncbi:hypothetical protein R3P38DRAFT_3420716 [Favolaschia claudopus]|uniref:Uncharacterized protein n=1 Tax=Favolaschia claudopus TaxID=2862362 RepID=A0AAW0D2Y9_9AGAR
MTTLESASDVFYALGIHRAPAFASVPEFERLMESIVDDCVNLLPVVQENCLKTPENIGKVLASPELRKKFQKGKDFGNQSSFFAYSKVRKIDCPAPDNGLQMVFVYDPPLELETSPNHIREFDDFMRGFMLLPTIQKHFARLEMWQSTDILDQDVRDFGYSTESRPALYCATLKDLDAAKQMMSDPATQRYFAGAAEGRQQLDLKKCGYWFIANVVTKLDSMRE